MIFSNLPFSAREHKSCSFAASCFATWDSPVVFTSQGEALYFTASALLFLKVVWPALTFATDDKDWAWYSRWGQCLLWQHSLLFLLGRSCLVHLLITFTFFVIFITFGACGPLGSVWDKSSLCIVTFSNFVSPAQITGTVFSLRVVIESIIKPGPLSQIILLSEQPLCKVSYAYQFLCQFSSYSA